MEPVTKRNRIAEERAAEDFKRQFALSPDNVVHIQRVPLRKPRWSKDFTKLPMWWFEPLNGASASAHRLAWWLTYLHWRNYGGPVKLANMVLETLGVSRRTKWRTLAELEHRGLIRVERRPRKSQLVHVLLERP